MANLKVKVIDRTGVVYEGDADSLSSVNDKGKFDVLEKHARFITLIQKELTIRKKGGQNKQIPVSNGVMRVYGEKVDIFLGIKA